MSLVKIIYAGLSLETFTDSYIDNAFKEFPKAKLVRDICEKYAVSLSSKLEDLGIKISSKELFNKIVSNFEISLIMDSGTFENNIKAFISGLLYPKVRQHYKDKTEAMPEEEFRVSKIHHFADLESILFDKQEEYDYYWIYNYLPSTKTLAEFYPELKEIKQDFYYLVNENLILKDLQEEYLPNIVERYIKTIEFKLSKM